MKAFVCLSFIFVFITPKAPFAFGSSFRAKRIAQTFLGTEDSSLPSQARISSFKEGKKGIQILPLDELQIEMPDGSFHNFGEDFQASLTTQLMESGRYIVMDVDPVQDMSSVQQRHLKWAASSTAAVKLKVQVVALSFETGSKDDSQFYGFNERMRTPFNDGYGSRKNEFPSKEVKAEGLNEVKNGQTLLEIPNPVPPPHPSYFGESFGRSVFEAKLEEGLSLNRGIDVNWFFGTSHLRYSEFHADIHLRLWMDTPLRDAKDFQLIEVKGTGYYLEASASSFEKEFALSYSRQDVMLQALKKAIDGTFQAVDQALRLAPLLARVDGILRDGSILLGTGEGANVPLGTLFRSLVEPTFLIEITSREKNGSIGKLLEGNLSWVQTGLLLAQEVDERPARKQQRHFRRPVPGESSTNIPEFASYAVSLISIELPEMRLQTVESAKRAVDQWRGFLLNLKNGLALPGQIWKTLTIDQSYHLKADQPKLGPVSLTGEAWATQIGLTEAPEMGSFQPVVAIIDSGADYNHPIIHDLIWQNPTPVSDLRGRLDTHGWDFLSNSPRPFDAGFHGTQLASLVATTAPKAKIMPLKTFDSSGRTHSAALYAAFLYAVDHGAHLILCGWSTRIDSDALSMGIAYAHEHGVAVVASGGDAALDLTRTTEPQFPATLSRKWSSVLAVGGLDAHDQWYPQAGDATSLQLLAPGKDIHVAEPGVREAYGSSTDLAAAITAGALARVVSAQNGEGSHVEWVQTLLSDADSLPSLESYVPHGLRLHVRH